MQRRPGRGLQQQLCTITPGPAFHRCRHGPQQLNPGQILLGQQTLGLAARFIEEAFGLPRFMRFGPQQREMRKRRQTGGAAFAQRLFGKGEIALFGQLHQQRMVRQVRLDNHFARFFGPPRAPGNLDDQLRHAFAGAEIAGEQSAVGIQNRHQGHPWKVVPFGKHLCADQNARLAFLNDGEQLIHRVFA